MNTFIKKNWLVILIFALSFFLRFWKVPELFFFDIDEEYQSLLALSIIKDFHLIWIGLSAANTGFYIASGLIYLHALLLWISKLDPVILGYAASVISMITIIVLHFIAKNLLGKKPALISIMLYSFIPFVLQYDRRFWNSTLVPITSLLIVFSLIKSFKDSRWHIFLAILMGAAFHIHASLLVYLPVYLFVLIWQLAQKKKVNFPILLVSIALFIILYSPLLVYDFVHNFDNLKTPFRLLQAKSVGAKFNDYYLLGFIPLISLLLSKYLSRLNTGALLIFAVFFVLNAFLTVTNWQTNSGLESKKILIQTASKKIGKQSFFLQTNEKYLYFGGWRYLFEAYGKKPVSSQADEMFGWIYPNEISSKRPSLKVIIIRNNKFKEETGDQIIRSGIYKAVIRKNE